MAKVAIGDGHSIFVLKGDYAYTTGRGGSGQLANGNTNNQSNYSFALSNVKAVAADKITPLFLLNDGSLYGSGGNDSGQLGLNHENNQTWPTQILASGVKSISAQNSHTLVVRNDGSLWGTGANNHYQLGLNDNIKRSQLTQIVSSGVKESKSGGAFSLFIKEDGSLWGMGNSNFGQLGMGDNNTHTTPVEIVPTGVRQVSAGQRHSLFIKNDGSVWGMGSNENGRLGLSDINTTNLPVQILPNGAKEVSTGLTHSLILMLDGTLLGSGVNSDGQLGLGDLNGRTTFTKIATGVMRLADVMNNEHIVPSANNMEMLWVDPGTFTMGSPVTETGRSSDETEHNVTLTRGFFLGKYEVTQAEYQAVMTGNTNGISATPSQYNGNPDRPVEKVSWDDVQIFLDRLNSQESNNTAAGWEYALPTEAEWEYACRANTITAYSWGNSIDGTLANYNSSGVGQTRDVGYYSSNPWGFYDMHGNVFEWTSTWYSTYPSLGISTDPIGPSSGTQKVIRGDSFYSDGLNLRSAKRWKDETNAHRFKPRLPSHLRQVSLPPTDLNSTAPLTIAENQPIRRLLAILMPQTQTQMLPSPIIWFLVLEMITIPCLQWNPMGP